VARPRNNDIHVQTTAKRIDVAHIALLMQKTNKTPKSWGELYRFAITALSEIAVTNFGVKEIETSYEASQILNSIMGIELDTELRFSRQSRISDKEFDEASLIIERERRKWIANTPINKPEEIIAKKEEIEKAIQSAPIEEEVSEEDKRYASNCYKIYKLIDKELLMQLSNEPVQKKRDVITDQRKRLMDIFNGAVDISASLPEKLKCLATLEQIQTSFEKEITKNV